MEKLTHFKIGQIVNTQGLKGEVRVYPFTDDIYRFDDLEEFYLGKDLETKWEVERVRYKGNMVIMKIKNVVTIMDMGLLLLVCVVEMALCRAGNILVSPRSQI